MKYRLAISRAFAIGALTTAPTLAWSQQKAVAQSPSVTGTWSGSVTQAGSAKAYSLVLKVRAKDGETDYPELSCGGRLTRVGSSSGYTFFIETITRGRQDQGGRCIDGSITIAPAGDQLAWGWVGSHQGKTLIAYSTLMRK